MICVQFIMMFSNISKNQNVPYLTWLLVLFDVTPVIRRYYLVFSDYSNHVLSYVFSQTWKRTVVHKYDKSWFNQEKHCCLVLGLNAYIIPGINVCPLDFTQRFPAVVKYKTTGFDGQAWGHTQAALLYKCHLFNQDRFRQRSPNWHYWYLWSGAAPV